MSNSNQDHSNKSGDDKLDMQSPDLVSQNFAKLAELFPNCVTESAIGKAIDFDLLKQELNHAVVEGNKERYRLEWPGKREAIVTANLPTTKTLRPVREDSVDFDNTENIYIEGDNLEVLKLLQESYLGKIKMIYIDPPYNTGKDFIYRDNFKKDKSEDLLESGQKDELSQRLIANPDVSGRYHSDWLNMIYPRLKLARNLLSKDGVIFISIDDNEAQNLKKICDEIFGEINHLVTHYIQVRYAGKTLAEKNNYQKLIEQVLVYQKSDHIPLKETEEYSLNGFKWKITELKQGIKEVIAGKEVEIFLPGTYEINEVPSSIDALKETWATGSVLKVNASGKFFGNNLAPRKDIDGLGVLYKVKGIGEDGIGYRYFTGPKRETASKGTFFSGVPLVRREEIASEDGSTKAKSIVNFYDFADSFGNCRHEGGISFRGGKKPIKFLQTLINQACKDGIVLDFFSGSGSTAHAVMYSNCQDGGSRKFICVQLPEPINPNDQDIESEFSTITELSKERIRRSISQLKDEHPNKADFGFRVYRLDESNMKDVYYRPQELDQAKMDLFGDNVKPDRTEDDLLAQVMLDWGLPLSLKIEQANVAGKKVFKVAENSLFACFDKGIDEAFAKEIAKEKPLRIVFKDAGFKDDTAKTNVKQLLKQLSPETEMKVL